MGLQALSTLTQSWWKRGGARQGNGLQKLPVLGPLLEMDSRSARDRPAPGGFAVLLFAAPVLPSLFLTLPLLLVTVKHRHQLSHIYRCFHVFTPRTLQTSLV